MRHLLTDPAFPDLVGEWADQMAGDVPANDNGHSEDDADDIAESILTTLAMLDVEATRAW